MTDAASWLILGGTAWLGGAVTEHALARGHRVTCLARGESGAVPPGASLVRADRRAPGAYDRLADRDWDVVLDVSREPEQVRTALDALSGRTRHWVYVSTISVYADHSRPGADESAPVLDPWTGRGEAPAEAYGSAKVSCETSCRASMPADRLLVARAGLIAGYGDPSDRFGYWPARFARSGPDDRVVVPPLGTAVQLVDVRDLAAWLVESAERRLTGTFDATGPQHTFADVVAACVAVTGIAPELVDPGDSRLLDAGVEYWAGPGSLPLWLPGTEYAGHCARAARAARAAGLATRPLAETAADALRWESEHGLHRERRAGLSAVREAELAARWARRDR